MIRNGLNCVNGSGNGNFKQNGKTLGFFEKIFNISPHEWSRVSVSWLMTFFARIGFVIGWITLTAMFVSKFGIAFLPTLYIVNAIFMILGSMLFSKLIHRIKRESLMSMAVLATGGVLLMATFFSHSNQYVYFALLIIAESIFVSQLFILLSVFIEHLFSPLEGERTFPFIESAETLGAVAGGLLITFFTARIPVSQLIFVWIFAVLAVLPVLAYYQQSKQRFQPALFKKIHVDEPKPQIKKWKEALEAIRAVPFLKVLFFIILTQWIFFNMLEFQYTKAVEQHVVNHKEETLVHNQTRIFHVSLLTDPHGAKASDKLFPSLKNETLDENQEKALTKTLGSLHVLFGMVALFTQLFFASKFIRAYGIVNSFLIHPLLLLLSYVGVFFKFGFTSNIIMRSTFEIGGVVHKNAYHSSYYALKPSVREQAHEFFDGLAKPLGIIIGMTCLLIFHFLLQEKMLTLGINIAMGTVLIVMLIETLDLRKKYTSLPKKILFSDEDEHEKWHAIEILTQKGHSRPIAILLEALELYDPVESLKIRILRALGKFKSMDALSAMINAFDDPRSSVRLAAVSSLAGFSHLGSTFYKQAFSRHRLIESLKHLFYSETSESIRGMIIHVFALLKTPDAIPFILEVLSHSSPKIKSQCIAVCGRFKDPNAAYYIYPYLSNGHPFIKAQTAATLMQYAAYKNRAIDTLKSMIQNGNKENLIAALKALPETDDDWSKKMLLFYLQDDDPDIIFESALSLAKLGDARSFEILADFLIDLTPEQLEEFKIVYKKLPPKIQHSLSEFLALYFAKELHRDISPDILMRLKEIYETLGYHEQAYEIGKAANALFSKEPLSAKI